MNKIGIRVTCAVCHRQKKPRGRSMPVGFNMCEPESCSAYYCEPRVGDLWPGETAQDFGYPCSDDGTDAEGEQ